MCTAHNLYHMHVSIILARFFERNRRIELLGIQSDGTMNGFVVLWLHQFPKHIGPRS